MMVRPPKFVSKYVSFCEGAFVVLALLTCRLPVAQEFNCKKGSQNQKV